MPYSYTIRKTYQSYGYPENEFRYFVSGMYFDAEVTYYGNHGFDVPKVRCTTRNNGYHWSVNTFMRAFYQDKLREYFLNLKDHESVTFELEHYQY